MRILVLGGDGYLGWPTAMHFSAQGHDVGVVDSFVKRKWELELGVEPLVPILTLHKRVKQWRNLTGKKISLFVNDLTNNRRLYQVFRDFQPEAIIHYGEQPSAPYSMMGRHYAVETQQNNIIGTLNVLYAMLKHCPNAHLIKLGTMGEYGTPNIDIEEGYIDIEHKGRKAKLPFPKQAGSLYHLTKVHDSANIEFACRIWGLKATDLNQGVVYGINTNHTVVGLNTSFHYDAIFGTVLNRFCVQAVIGEPLTVYGKGGQTRGYLNIRDTIQCVELAALNPPSSGEFRVFNQFTELFSVNDLAELVVKAGEDYGLSVEIDHMPNPRIEAEEHYYNPVHKKLQELGLKPTWLSDTLVNEIFDEVERNRYRIDRSLVRPDILWRHN